MGKKSEKNMKPFAFEGQIIALTKVKNDEGMAIRVTITGGFYFEVSSIQDKTLFEEFSKIIELDRPLKIVVVG